MKPDWLNLKPEIVCPVCKGKKQIATITNQGTKFIRSCGACNSTGFSTNPYDLPWTSQITCCDDILNDKDTYTEFSHNNIVRLTNPKTNRVEEKLIAFKLTYHRNTQYNKQYVEKKNEQYTNN